MKNFEDATRNASEIELLQFRSVRLIGSYARVWTEKPFEVNEDVMKSCETDEIKKKLKNVPSIIPNCTISWWGEYQPDGSAIYIYGVFAPPNTKCPQGLIFKDISAELSSDILAKGIDSNHDAMHIINKFKDLGYESPYCGIESYGWWEGEMHFDDEYNHSIIMPVRKIGRELK